VLSCQTCRPAVIDLRIPGAVADFVVDLAKLVARVDLVQEVEPYPAGATCVERIKRLLQQNPVIRAVAVVSDAKPQLETACTELPIVEPKELLVAFDSGL